MTTDDRCRARKCSATLLFDAIDFIVAPEDDVRTKIESVPDFFARISARRPEAGAPRILVPALSGLSIVERPLASARKP